MTCPTFSSVKILESCKNKEGLPRHLYQDLQCRQGIGIPLGRFAVFKPSPFYLHCILYSYSRVVSALALTLLFFFFLSIITYILNSNVFSLWVGDKLTNREKGLTFQHFSCLMVCPTSLYSNLNTLESGRACCFLCPNTQSISCTELFVPAEPKSQHMPHAEPAECNCYDKQADI